MKQDTKITVAYPFAGEAVELPPSQSHFAKRLARGASVYVAGLVAGKGLTVILQVVLGRWLGPSSYGLYALGYGVVGLVQWVTSLGMDQGVLRYCALYRTRNQPVQLRATVRRALQVAVPLSLLVAGVLANTSRQIAARLFTPEFSGVLAIFALSLPFLIVTRIAATFVQSLNDIYRMTVLQLVARPSANLILVVVAIALELGLKGAVSAYLIGSVASAILAISYLRQKLPPSANAAAETDHSPLMRYSLTLMLVGLSYQVILRISVLLLGHLGGSAEVGIYSAGASFALAFGFMPLSFEQPALPMMVELYEGKRLAELRTLYRNVARWNLAVVLPFFLFLCLFRAEVMQLFGRNFSAGGAVLLILSLGWLIYYGKGPAGGLLEMTGRQNLQMINIVGIAALMIIANYLAIPRYKAGGAAAATALSIAVWALVEYVEVRLIYRISPWGRGALRNILVALIVAATATLIQPLLSWEFSFLIAAGLYAALYLGLCLEPEDRFVARAALARARAWFQRASTAPSNGP